MAMRDKGFRRGLTMVDEVSPSSSSAPSDEGRNAARTDVGFRDLLDGFRTIVEDSGETSAICGLPYSQIERQLAKG